MKSIFGGYFPRKTVSKDTVQSLAQENGASVISVNDGDNAVLFGSENTISSSKDNTYVLLFQGRVWNLPQIRQSLKSDGTPIPDAKDSLAVLRESLAQNGVAAVKDWNGHFSFAFLDRQKKTMLLGRDRFGVQPLYYHFDGYAAKCDGFAFSTTLEALRGLPSFQKDSIRADAVLDFLCVQYIPGEKTLYNHSFKLLPGYVLTYSMQDRTIALDPYFTWPQYGLNRHISYADACAELRLLVEQSVKARIHSQDGVKAFLSGGLDSAILTGLAADMTDISIYSASIIDEMCREYDEKSDALATYDFLCQRFGKKFPIQVTEVKSNSIDALAAHDDPFANASLLPFAALCQEAGSGTVLTGEGGDELFFGYDRYRAMRLFRHVQFLPCKLLAKICPRGNERSLFGRAKRFFKTAAAERSERYFNIISHHAREEFADLLGEGLKNARSSFATAGSDYGYGDAAEAAARFDLQFYLPGDGFQKCRFGALGTDCEFPMPFLDNAVADFAIGLPPQFKLLGKQRKRILCDAFADILPPGLSKRKKRGFGVPIGKWLCVDRRDALHDAIVKNPPACFEKWFERHRIAAMIEEQALGRADHTYLLHSLYALALYLRKYPFI